MRKILKRKVVKYLKTKSFYIEEVQHSQYLLGENSKLQQVISDNKPVLEYFWFVEPGHYYSPLLNRKGLKFNHLQDLRIPSTNQKKVDLPGIELNSSAQRLLLTKLSEYAGDIPDYDDAKGLRYRYENDQFGRMDASILFLILRHFKPSRVIEVGSGWSSALMLDVKQKFPKSPMDLTFIEPYPERLYTALKAGDKANCTILAKPVQKISPDEFKTLGKNDILFIDSSHVSKFGSDVNYLYLKILPSLKPGVLIHVHDIFYPFEYPLQWVKYENRNWNETYLLHALLVGSNLFEIVLWPSYLKVLDEKRFNKLIPTAPGAGGSIWLRKL